MEPRPHSLDWELIERYLAGDLRGAEWSRAESMVRAHPQLRAMLEAVEQGLAEVGGDAPQGVERAYAALSARLRVGKHVSAPEKLVGRVGRRKAWRGMWPSGTETLRIGLLIIACTGFAWFAYGSFRRTDHASHRLYYATRQGQRLTTTLPDGSQITLAPQSYLRYAIDSQGARSITLSGRAYFSVMHDAHHPFAVRTGGIHTQVLGTAFDIRHYPEDSTVQIVVVEGKVAARGRDGRGAPVLLVAGTEGRLTDSTALVITDRKTDDAEAWMHGRLVFDDTPVAEMLRTLQRWYGYEFRLADSAMAQRQVTTMFLIGDTTRTLAGLKTLLDVTMRFEGSVIVLVPVQHAQRNVFPVDRHTPLFPSQSEVGK